MNRAVPDHPPVFCINLAASVARRARMERRLAHHDLLDRTTFVTAIPADSLPLSGDAKHRGGQACSASHLKALATFLAETPADVSGAIVFEDDVLLHNDWHAGLAALFDNFPADAEVCTFTYFVETWDGTGWCGRVPELANVSRMTDRIWSCGAYWISRDYAAALLAKYDVLPGELPDETERFLHEARAYLCYPPLALVDAIDSTIRGAEVEWHFNHMVQWPYDEYSNCEGGQSVSPLARPERRLERRLALQRPPRELAALAPSAKIGEIRLEVEPSWPQFNPSIAQNGDEFRLLVRTAGYRLEHGHHVLRSLYYVVELDHALEVREVSPLVDGSCEPPIHPSHWPGFEDCRLFRLGDAWLASATVWDRRTDGRCEMALLTLEGAAVTDVRILPGPTPGRLEKNWMPFVREDALHFVYTCGPTTILRFDRVSGRLERIADQPAPPRAAGFRGGSQGLAVEDGTLFVVHEVDAQRRYIHRFVLLDTEYRLCALSAPFRFHSDGVEFCAGLARRGAQLLLSFGVGDAAAGVAVVGEEEVLALLEG